MVVRYGINTLKIKNHIFINWKKMQRILIISITNNYRSTNNEKLQKLIKINDIEEEWEKTIDIDKSKRKKIKRELRMMYLEEKSDYGAFGDLDEVSSRYIFCCISSHGPFKEYLFRLRMIMEYVDIVIWIMKTQCIYWIVNI